VANATAGELPLYAAQRDDGLAHCDAEHECPRIACCQAGVCALKEKLRSFIGDADLYHISARPDGLHWNGVEYYDERQQRALVFAFRGSAPDAQAHTFLLYGLQPSRRYRLHFQGGSSPNRTESGHELMNKGLSITLAVPNSSELVFIDEIK
jgi:alpha-galactosidase